MADKDEVLRRAHDEGIIGIFRLDSEEDCFKAIDALRAGGLHVLELTMTTPNALGIIERARARVGRDTVLGMGTVLDAESAERAIDAGAQFIVSPSLHKEILDICRKRDVVSCPGTFTATEIVQARNWGADMIKVFPISQVGPGYIRALLSPLPWAKLVPTGGVNAENAAAYIREGAFCLGVGEGIVSRKAVSSGRFDQITQATRQVLDAVKAARNE